MAIARNGGIDAVVLALKNHRDNVNVQQNGCRAIGQFAYKNGLFDFNCCNDSDENRVTIARAGGVDATVAALKRHIGNPGVQEAGCAALRHLAYNNGNQV